MEKFLEKIQAEIEKKMLTCLTGESIVKPFNQVYEEVRKKTSKKNDKIKNTTKIYSDGEDSIYNEIVKKFLEENPELLQKE